MRQLESFPLTQQSEVRVACRSRAWIRRDLEQFLLSFVICCIPLEYRKAER